MSLCIRQLFQCSKYLSSRNCSKKLNLATPQTCRWWYHTKLRTGIIQVNTIRVSKICYTFLLGFIYLLSSYTSYQGFCFTLFIHCILLYTTLYRSVKNEVCEREKRVNWCHLHIKSLAIRCRYYNIELREILIIGVKVSLHS